MFIKFECKGAQQNDWNINERYFVVMSLNKLNCTNWYFKDEFSNIEKSFQRPGLPTLMYIKRHL